MVNGFQKMLLPFLLLTLSWQPSILMGKPLELVAAKMTDKVAAKTLLDMSKYIALHSKPSLKISQKPISRTYYELENFSGLCSLSIIRSDSTEHKFNWLVPSFITHFSVVKRKNDPVVFNPVNSIIAVPKGSIMSKKLKQESLVVTTVKSRQDILNLMEKTDIHFWGDADRAIENLENQTAGLSFEVVRRLPAIEMWVACSKKTEPEAMEALKIQWQKAKESPKFQTLHDQLFQLFLR